MCLPFLPQTPRLVEDRAQRGERPVSRDPRSSVPTMLGSLLLLSQAPVPCWRLHWQRFGGLSLQVSGAGCRVQPSPQ